ncbi:MAG: hypothetical protein ACLPTF_25495 [Steroidobacteraceae bacterium]
MKHGKLWLAMAASVIGLALQSPMVWATRAVGAKITGQITSTPSADQIEVDHHVYLIKKNAPAAKTYRNFYHGDTVDLFFERPATQTAPTVVSIVKHAGS